MSKLSKACEISPKVREKVLDRDEFCILCGKVGIPNSHFVAKAQHGLGVEQNIVTMCVNCHDKWHTSGDQAEMKERVREYLEKHYPGFPDADRVYKKYGG